MRVLPLVLVALSPSLSPQDPATSPVATIRAEAERVLALVTTPGAKSFLRATSALPSIAERQVYVDSKTRAALTPEEYAELGPEQKQSYAPVKYGEDFYYSTKYGTPIAYARALDLIGRASGAGAGDALSGKRVLDFGYGGIGHLRLLASLGCDAVGVEVDPLLRAFYRPEDQGVIPAALPGGKPGRLQLVHGSWPGDEKVKQAVGGAYDLVLSKNVLKLGYVRPAQEVNPAMLVQLGVTPPQFLAEVARALKPGGLFAIYNLCPAARTDRYVPWAYGQSPFTKEEFAAAGFELLSFDVDDREEIQELAWALGWDEQGQDVENDLFAWYTIARRKEG